MGRTILIYAWAPIANLLWYANTVVMATLSLLLSPFDRTGRIQHWCARWWCRVIAWTIFARIRVSGTEHVRPDRAYVYMANHSSLIDTPALFAYLPYPFWIMAKRELFWIPFMGWHLWAGGHFPIDRRDARRTASSVRAVIDGVKQGRSLAVFPEGTRTRDGRLQPFQTGAFRIAIKAAVPIVPVAIRGAYQLLPRTSLAPKPGRIEVIVGEPIDTAPYADDVPALVERTRRAIQRALDEPSVGPLVRAR